MENPNPERKFPVKLPDLNSASHALFPYMLVDPLSDEQYEILYLLPVRAYSLNLDLQDGLKGRYLQILDEDRLRRSQTSLFTCPS